MMTPMQPPATLPADLADDLDLIAGMTAEFARSRDIEETLRLGLARIALRVGAEAASLFLLDDEADELVCHACFGPVDVTGLRLAEGSGIVWRTLALNQPQMVEDTSDDPDFSAKIDAGTGFFTRSILCAPLSVREDRLGAIELLNKRGSTHFDEGDRLLLQALGASAALALINARQAAQMAAAEALAREIELAADIQRAMLPAVPPPGFPVHGINVPARVVSGDFFDALTLADGRIAFAIADVSGKGIKAALLMARTASLFRCLAKRIAEPGRLLAAIDAELSEKAAPGMFVTMIVGILDPVARTAVLANAGHEPPMLIRGDAVLRIEGGLPPLGILPELFAAGCPEQSVDLDGAALYLFTDGLTEASGPGGAMLEAEGVVALIGCFALLPPALRLACVVAGIKGDGEAPKDDLTLVALDCSTVFERRFPARAEMLKEIRAGVEEAALRAGLDEHGAADIALAVDEACQNIIRHAYKGEAGDIVLGMQSDGKRLVVHLVDFARPVDPKTVCPRDLDDLRPGGLGTHFICQVMDEVVFLAPPPGVGNVLQLTKRIVSP